MVIVVRHLWSWKDHLILIVATLSYFFMFPHIPCRNGSIQTHNSWLSLNSPFSHIKHNINIPKNVYEIFTISSKFEEKLWENGASQGIVMNNTITTQVLPRKKWVTEAICEFEIQHIFILLLIPSIHTILRKNGIKALFQFI